MQSWFDRTTIQQQKALIQRLRSDRDANFLGAWFELLLHELLRRSGAASAYEPGVRRKQTVPDYQVRLPDGRAFVLEATTVWENTSEQGGERNLGELLDAIGSIPHPTLQVLIDAAHLPARSLPIMRICNEVREWLDGLDPEDVRSARRAGNEEPLSLTVRADEWEMILKPYAPPCKKRDRLIAGESGRVHWSKARTLVGNKLKDKARHYGILDSPLVIALNIVGPGFDTETLVDALFGQIAVQFPRDPNDPAPTRVVRLPTGVLGTPSEPEYTRISGVLWVWNLHPWNVAHRRLEWIANQWAARPLSDVGIELPRFVAQEGSFEKHDGIPLHMLLGLWPGWPEDLST